MSVGCGNMTLILFPNGVTWLYDCNITYEEEDNILSYLRRAMNGRRQLDLFICSHRDADHMRGIRTLHDAFPIALIADSDLPGTTTDSSEYLEYMKLRREIGSKVIKPRTVQDVGGAVARWMNAADQDFSDANDQSIVLKIEYNSNSVLLPGDTSFRPWKDKILPYYSVDKISSDILLASHHGSLSFFDDPADEKNYFTDHIRKIKPAMTILSIGPNVHDLPDAKAISFYEKYSTGSKKGNKLRRTDEHGNIKLELKEDDGWLISIDQ